MLTLPPLSLYIHIPWCVQKCPYCDFNSHGQNGELPQQEYVDALLADLKNDLHYVQGREIHTIFIGGGTPSLFDAAQIERLLTGVNEMIPFSEQIEITMEANPGTLEHDDFEAYSKAGVTRLSIGVQSFSTDKLNLLGRIHGKDEAEVAAQKAQSSGYRSFNLDLMHGLPNQSFEEAMADIDTAAKLSPPHLSWYQLTIEQNTLFHSKPPQLPDDEALWHIYEQGQKKLADLGYEQYEISAYAKPGFQCQHNINYWQFGDYLGIGCGAHGKVTLLEQNQILRTVKIKHPKGYLAADEYTFDTVEVTEDERPLEYLMNRFRLMSAIPKAEFEQRTGLSHRVIAQGIEKAKSKTLLIENETHWELTAKGKMFVNELLSQFC
ncbi:radical SAM family heme chaperone HemW [Shewanella psychropiezotolerans]|uniref:Heme chaperone HemW n=1 Tax=Shewanella psychropiezotolerans TaxID=2593655 RepID=A0ABX5X1T9_9GAMM|nr:MULTISPECIES: radical SAM family heme chaperone HemW [Shewanella]MPY21020.1 radical SAM family heme chaperone HemW [Shewanella sp. YLB-07]MPY21807.1 radical SAM family heme chaperone HemW [Shewanella sp. YLB-07]QDO85301.1 radical SAM family heme chaperone HemW [Shewanella psychropiezotolerans]